MTFQIGDVARKLVARKELEHAMSLEGQRIQKAIIHLQQRLDSI